MALRVNIRYDSHHCIQLQVEDTWSVAQVKQQLQSQHDIPADECHLIFLGRELPDDLIIRDCNLGQQSLLHMVRGRPRGRRLNIPTDSGLNQLSAIREEITLSETTSGEIPQFYVYCKSTCHDIKPGKLRVRCAQCKEGSFLLDKEPEGWEDVQQPQRLHGVCQEQGCTGIDPEFYFRCLAHEGDLGDNAVALDLIRSNTRHVPCITCTEILSPIIVFPCVPGHTMCLECFQIYCTTKLNDRDFIETEAYGYTLNCPAGCENSMIKDAHHFRILGNDQYDRYQRFGTEEYILKMGGVLCPRPGCGAGLLPDPDISRVICMQGCGHVFCRHCNEPIHNGDCSSPQPLPTASQQGYRVDEENAVRARWEEDSRRTIDATTKRCPGCNAPTEKIDGCMHMTCSRCHFEWCWICCVEWNRQCQGDHWFD